MYENMTPAPNSPAADAIITTVEAGRLLGVSRQTVRKMCISGELPHWKPSQRTIRLRAKDVLEFKAARTFGGAS
jgi:excisionase family DNA binding protein